MAAVLGLAAILAVWMDLSPLHRFHNSDSLIPVLMSLDRWTPFFWEQNRFGMLVPLLAVPFQDPFTNLLVQVALRLFALVLSFFLLARTVVRRAWWPAVGALALGLFLLGKDLPQHNFQQMQPYFQALALALPGVALLERPDGRRALAASALFALAFWVAPVTLFWLVPLLGLRRVLGLEAKDNKDGKVTKDKISPASLASLKSLRSLLPFLLAALAFGGSLLASRLSVYHRATELGAAPVSAWPQAWLALAERVVTFLGPWLLAGIGFLLLASLVSPHPRPLSRKRERGEQQEMPSLCSPLPLAGEGPGVRASALCLLGTAAAELLILGTSGWVHLNEFRPRFLAVTFLATATAGPVLLLGLLLEGRPERWGRVANAVALAALLPLTLWRFGPPSPAAARAALLAGPDAEAVREVVADGCTHVLGDYWRVWPAVLQARVLLRESGAARQVWGIAYRSTPTADLWRWRDWRPARIAVLGPPRSAERVRAFYRIPRFGDPRGPARCAARRPMVSFRGFRLPVRPETAGAMLPEEPETR